MSANNIKEIIKRLESEKKEISRKIRKEGDAEAYLSNQIEKIDARIQIYKERLKKRK